MVRVMAWGTGILAVALVSSVVLNVAFLAIFGSGEGWRGVRTKVPEGMERVIVERQKAEGSGYIAVIPLRGVIQSDGGGEIGASMVDDFKIALRSAVVDKDVVAIVLAINSPGGEVTASDVLYHEVVEATDSKPVVAAMGALGASGAYYVACGTDYIIANETTFTGSIGVIIHSMNYEGLLGKVGLTSLVFKSGKFKDMLSGAREPTIAEIDYVQSIVAQVYDKFLDIVADSRGLSANDLRDGAADGRILTGKDAKKLGLVDATGYLENAYDKARELAGAEGAGILRYRPEASFRRVLRQLGAARDNSFAINLLGETGQTFIPRAGMAYYMQDFGYFPRADQ